MTWSPGETIEYLLNAWTTMAAAVARAYAKSTGNIEQPIASAYANVADHVWRAANIDPRSVAVMVPGADSFPISSPEARNGLTHVGLARLAVEWAAETGSSPKLIDVVTALSHHLEDGRFDGMPFTAAGTPTPVSVAGKFPLRTDTTRVELAKAIWDWCQSNPEGEKVDQQSLLAPGGLYENSFEVVAEDHAGNSAELSGKILYDPDPPVLVVTEPPHGSWVPTGEPALAGTVTDTGVGGMQLTVKNLATDKVVPAQLQPGPGNEWSATSPNSLVDGPLDLQVTATDALANATSVLHSLKVDTTPPVLDVAAGIDGSYTNQPQVTLSGTLEDAGCGPASVIIQPPGTTVATAVTLWQLIAALPDKGSMTWTLVGQDAVGHQSKPQSVTVHVDKDPPELTVTKPATQVAWKNSATIIEGTASDAGSGVAAVLFQVGSDAAKEAKLTSTAPGEWQWEYTFQPTDEGKHAINIWAVDKLGQASPKAQRIMYFDKTPPTVQLGQDEGYVPEWACKVSFAGTGVTCDCPETAIVVLSDSCKPDCGSVNKFVHRFGYGLPQLDKLTLPALLAANLPFIRPVATDKSSDWGGMTQIEFRFLKAEAELIGWQALPAVERVPIATQAFLGSAAIPDSKNLLPTSVQIRAFDQAGVVSDAQQYTFDLKLLTPLANVQITAMPGGLALADGTPCSFQSLKIHEPFKLSGALSLALARATIKNPYPMPVLVKPAPLSTAAGELTVTVSGKRVYGEAQSPNRAVRSASASTKPTARVRRHATTESVGTSMAQSSRDGRSRKPQAASRWRSSPCKRVKPSRSRTPMGSMYFRLERGSLLTSWSSSRGLALRMRQWRSKATPRCRRCSCGRRTPLADCLSTRPRPTRCSAAPRSARRVSRCVLPG